MFNERHSMPKRQQLSELLGRGMYSIAEAAFYAQVSPAMVSRWLRGNKKRKPVFKTELNPDKKIVTFLDFIQIVAVRTIRTNYGLSLQKIRSGIKKAETKYGISYPLAHQHTTYLREDHTELVIQIGGQFIEVTGKHTDSILLKTIIEPYLKDVGFDSQGLARRYCRRWNNHKIIMDPHIRFGEPLVDNTGYTAEALYDSAIAEGSFKKAARAYGVTESQVEAAFSFFESLLLAA